jgi:gamma-polyglutamate synthase
MYVIYVLLVLFFILVIYGVVEYFLHQRRVYSIPIRIHVNGTRGKSSVTRLIGAALSEAGIRTITKVTGTYPRLILEDSTEADIYRKTSANIIEQLSIVKLAAERKTEALVVECMALQPQYQEITEKKMIHATIGIITNVRLDHVEIMGYSLEEIASALAKTIPARAFCFTSEEQMLPILKKSADAKKSTLIQTVPESVTDSEMSGFKYMEHKENVALALAVCSHLSISRETALKGMYKANPDAGVLQVYSLFTENKNINFYNAFAANDPQSTMMILRRIKSEGKLKGNVIVLLNTREDRLDRARQLSVMTGRNLSDDLHYLILIGQATGMVESLCIQSGVAGNRILNLGWTDPQNVYSAIISCTEKESTVLALGNMGGMGAKVAEMFEQRSYIYD